MELLVVVLIIGILSSMALPKYVRAVERARAADAVTQIGNYTRAMDAYILENGFQFNGDMKKRLDITIPQSNDISHILYCSTNSHCLVRMQGGDWRLDAVRYQNQYGSAWKKSCFYWNSTGRAVCEGLKGIDYAVNVSY